VQSLPSWFTGQRATIWLDLVAYHEGLLQESEEEGQGSGQQPATTIAPGQITFTCTFSHTWTVHSQSWRKTLCGSCDI